MGVRLAPLVGPTPSWTSDQEHNRDDNRGDHEEDQADQHDEEKFRGAQHAGQSTRRVRPIPDKSATGAWPGRADPIASPLARCVSGGTGTRNVPESAHKASSGMNKAQAAIAIVALT